MTLFCASTKLSVRVHDGGLCVLLITMRQILSFDGLPFCNCKTASNPTTFRLIHKKRNKKEPADWLAVRRRIELEIDWARLRRVCRKHSCQQNEFATTAFSGLSSWDNWDSWDEAHTRELQVQKRDQWVLRANLDKDCHPQNLKGRERKRDMPTIFETYAYTVTVPLPYISVSTVPTRRKS